MYRSANVTRSAFILSLVLACGNITRAAEPPAKPSAEQIQQWAKQLSDDNFSVREQATRNLSSAGPRAVPAVIRALKAEDPEVRARANTILERWVNADDKAILAAIENESPKLGRQVAELRRQRAFRWLRKHGKNGRNVDLGRYTDEELASLKALDLDNTKITDAGLAHLKGLTSLEYLGLRNAKITDAGLAHLKGLTSLEKLDLINTKITGAGLAHLKALTSLKVLYLQNTKVTDAGLAHLKGLKSLTYLTLFNTPITDSGLAHLKGLTSLKTLTLSYTKVTDAGLAHLKGMASVMSLDLSDTKITDAGIKSLKSSLPSVTIRR